MIDFNLKQWKKEKVLQPNDLQKLVWFFRNLTKESTLVAYLKHISFILKL